MGRGKSTKSPQTRVMLEESKGERGAQGAEGGKRIKRGQTGGRWPAGRPASWALSHRLSSCLMLSVAKSFGPSLCDFHCPMDATKASSDIVTPSAIMPGALGGKIFRAAAVC